ncbi:hypothetical protein EJB05_27372, partial [Eragrostis curvula]
MLRSLTLDIKWEVRDDDDQLGSLWEPPLEIERLHLSRWLFPRVPKWIGGHLSKLCSLTLYVMDMSRDRVQALAELPSLLFLRLAIKSCEDMTVIDFGSAGFPSLEHLDFCGSMDAAAYMRFSAGVMRRLRRLTLRFGYGRAKNVATLVGIRHLPSLRCIHALVWTCAESDVRKIEHQLGKLTQAHPNQPSFTMDRYPNEWWDKIRWMYYSDFNSKLDSTRIRSDTLASSSWG